LDFVNNLSALGLVLAVESSWRAIVVVENVQRWIELAVRPRRGYKAMEAVKPAASPFCGWSLGGAFVCSYGRFHTRN